MAFQRANMRSLIDAPVSPGASLHKRRKAFKRRQNVGILYALPAVLLVIVFFLMPLGLMVWMSFHNWPLLGAIRFVNVGNYRALFADSTFFGSLLFTLKYAVIVTPLLLVIGFGLAILVKTNRKGVGLFRASYFMPLVIGFAAASYLWVWLLNPQVGIVDKIIHDLLGAQKPVEWLATAGLAVGAVVFVVIWKTVGFSMILLVGGLQGIPLEVNEAVAIDGAGILRKLKSITLPLLRRTFALVLVSATVGSFLAFDQFYVLTRGGPGSSTMTVVYWIFNMSFFSFRLGYGAAASVVLLILLLALAAVEMRLLRDDTKP